MKIFDSVTPRLEAAVAARLARLPMARHPALFFNLTTEGYRGYAFGGRAGPSLSVTHVFHELAHAAQFGPEQFRRRAGYSGFHFRTPQRYIFQRLMCEPLTMQSTAREVETFAYQLHLMRAAGCRIREDVFFAEAARALPFMPDWYWVPGKGDDGRRKHLLRAMRSAYRKVSQDVALHRLEGWLDKTRARLKRTGKTLFADESAPRRFAVGPGHELVPIAPGQVFSS